MLALVIALIILSIVCYVGQGFIISRSAAILSDHCHDLMKTGKDQ